MTRVLLYRAADGHLAGYEVSGHTGYAEAGQDIVCAALSFLSITCANALTQIAQAEAEIRQKDGYLKVVTRESSVQAQTILETFALGIRDLSETYPDHFRLSEARPEH